MFPQIWINNSFHIEQSNFSNKIHICVYQINWTSLFDKSVKPFDISQHTFIVTCVWGWAPVFIIAFFQKKKSSQLLAITKNIKMSRILWRTLALNTRSSSIQPLLSVTEGILWIYSKIITSKWPKKLHCELKKIYLFSFHQQLEYNQHAQ